MIYAHCISKIGNIIVHYIFLQKKKESCSEANIATFHVN